MYGAQTREYRSKMYEGFENDVEMYGAQTINSDYSSHVAFENDVEMYGAQTCHLVAPNSL